MQMTFRNLKIRKQWKEPQLKHTHSHAKPRLRSASPLWPPKMGAFCKPRGEEAQHAKDGRFYFKTNRYGYSCSEFSHGPRAIPMLTSVTSLIVLYFLVGFVIWILDLFPISLTEGLNQIYRLRFSEPLPRRCGWGDPDAGWSKRI